MRDRARGIQKDGREGGMILSWELSVSAKGAVRGSAG